jgi:glycosyltransferase involved in cell wall biosynthesis
LKTKITYILSNIDKALAFEWIAENLDQQKFELDFILMSEKETEIERFLARRNIPFERIVYKGKNNILSTIVRIRKLLRRNKTQIVHTHLFNANLVGLLAAKLAGVPRRIYTRHHSSYHHVYYPHAVKYDRLVNSLATDIVAVSVNVKSILIDKEQVTPAKVHLIHHGFAIENFINVPVKDIEEVEKKYNPQKQYPVVGVISRYLKLKGLQYILPAFSKLLNDYPYALLILGNANGNYKEEIQKLLQTIPKKNYIEIPFENNIFALYKLFDVFVHTPVNNHCEAFGQTYVEALASGVPSIFTLSGIANEFIKGRQNALVIPYENSEAVYDALLELLMNKELSNKLTESGRKDVKEIFPLNRMIEKLESLYLNGR